jgi:hypothetical protein
MTLIRKASREKKKIKGLLSASSGAGKTWGSLMIAKGLVGSWDKICIIDTENKSSDLYANLGDYSVVELDAPYTPEAYIKAMKDIEAAGYEAIIIDSITHEWAGEGGCLEQHNKLGGKFTDWGKVTPRHNQFINTILKSNCHVLCTVRRKEEYTQSQGNDGKQKVVKLGLQEITRDGFTYEMDFVFEIDNSTHLVTCTKDRTQLFVDRDSFLITEQTGEELREWSNSGKERDKLGDALGEIRVAEDMDSLLAVYNRYKELHTNEVFTKEIKEKKEYINKINN